MASPYHIFRFLTKSVSLQCCKYFASFASLAFRILHHHKKEKPVPAIAYAAHHLLMPFTLTGCKLLARLSRIVFHRDCIRQGGNRMSSAAICLRKAYKLPLADGPLAVAVSPASFRLLRKPCRNPENGAYPRGSCSDNIGSKLRLCSIVIKGCNGSIISSSVQSASLSDCWPASTGASSLDEKINLGCPLAMDSSTMDSSVRAGHRYCRCRHHHRQKLRWVERQTCSLPPLASTTVVSSVSKSQQMNLRPVTYSQLISVCLNSRCATDLVSSVNSKKFGPKCFQRGAEQLLQ